MDSAYLDLETTGLGQDAEILEIGILDDKGQVLLDSLVRPILHNAWPSAERIHGIGVKDVRDAPVLDELRPRIIEAVKGRQVVIYNAAFDSRFLSGELQYAASIECAMLAFARHYGEWSEYHGNYKWQTLSMAAGYVLFRWEGESHRAIHDCQATRAVWRYLTDEAERVRVDAARAIIPNERL